MGYWGKFCRFDSVDFIRRVRNILGRQSNDSAFFAADTSVFDEYFAVTPGIRAALIRFRKISAGKWEACRMFDGTYSEIPVATASQSIYRTLQIRTFLRIVASVYGNTSESYFL